MFKQFIDKLQGADVFMCASFLTFFVFFLAVGTWLIFADKNHLKELGNIPLNDN